MNIKDLIKVFDFLEEECNKYDLLEFKLTDRNQITAYFKKDNKPYAVFYIKRVLQCIEENNKQ